jgi:phage terminase small subunit
MENKEKQTPNTKTKTKRKTNPYSKALRTNTGHTLTDKEAAFIDNYIASGNQRQAVLESGYKTNCPSQVAQIILNKSYIKEEIDFRRQQLASQRIASAQEILEYFTSVVRGEIKDQFGLEAPLSERTKAAQELAKRQIDVPNRIHGKQEENTIKLVIERRKPNGENVE